MGTWGGAASHYTRAPNLGTAPSTPRPGAPNLDTQGGHRTQKAFCQQAATNVT